MSKLSLRLDSPCSISAFVSVQFCSFFSFINLSSTWVLVTQNLKLWEAQDSVTECWLELQWWHLGVKPAAQFSCCFFKWDSMCWHLHSLAFEGFGNAWRFPVCQNWSLSLAFSLSAPSNQCIHGGFVGVRTPQRPSPAGTSVSQHICVLWMGSALQFALILAEKGGEEGHCHLQVLCDFGSTWGIWVPRSTWITWVLLTLPVIHPLLGSQTNHVSF